MAVLSSEHGADEALEGVCSGRRLPGSRRPLRLDRGRRLLLGDARQHACAQLSGWRGERRSQEQRIAASPRLVHERTATLAPFQVSLYDVNLIRFEGVEHVCIDEIVNVSFLHLRST